MNRRRAISLLACAGGWAVAGRGCGPIPSRLPRRLDGTFLQIWKDDRAAPRSVWERRMRRLRTLACRRLILQWSRYGDDDALSPRFLDTLLNLAWEQDIRVTVGLPYDPRYWRVLDDPDPAVRAAFMAQCAAHGATFLKNNRSRSHPAFAGFYVPYEIDQYSWQSEQNQTTLVRALADLTDAAGTRAPLAVSTFHSALPATTDLHDLWRTILDAVAIRPLVQDGTGGFGVANYTRLSPLFALLRARAVAFDVIVELFATMPATGGGAFNAIAAPMARLRSQLAAAAGSGAARLIGFAVDPYMTNRVPGGNDLRRAYERALYEGGIVSALRDLLACARGA